MLSGGESVLRSSEFIFSQSDWALHKGATMAAVLCPYPPSSDSCTLRGTQTHWNASWEERPGWWGKQETKASEKWLNRFRAFSRECVQDGLVLVVEGGHWLWTLTPDGSEFSVGAGVGGRQGEWVLLRMCSVPALTTHHFLSPVTAVTSGWLCRRDSSPV